MLNLPLFYSNNKDNLIHHMDKTSDFIFNRLNTYIQLIKHITYYIYNTHQIPTARYLWAFSNIYSFSNQKQNLIKLPDGNPSRMSDAHMW